MLVKNSESNKIDHILLSYSHASQIENHEDEQRSQNKSTSRNRNMRFLESPHHYEGRKKDAWNPSEFHHLNKKNLPRAQSPVKHGRISVENHPIVHTRPHSQHFCSSCTKEGREAPFGGKDEWDNTYPQNHEERCKRVKDLPLQTSVLKERKDGKEDYRDSL